jgi:hypothetical protein
VAKSSKKISQIEKKSVNYMQFVTKDYKRKKAPRDRA